ncbi:MAG: NAD(P)/FAD-dependent oxidoreductase [Candidatus Binatus sp.]|uniref:flavin-containing monooxygenase n=1 Tax=Candidatus Binatus sp. TaxID=2811406 RepID=UPI0027266718|nr:NAD(P)/FAD-dependent oxidoreductase [Candidatus Binatus sp.]MDO8432102.1 NAD(P)/FAD-dependent oxidoreductase [Candidatus Binatus sp.]
MSNDTSSNGGQVSGIDFDPEALRARYRQERDKRMRADGNQQYVETKGDFSRYVDDPYVDPGFTREPLNDSVEVVIIGGGFGGLLAAARLREAGMQNIRIIEKGGDFGGTWYWNRYPGAQCDVESYIYLPLLEETGYIPKERYSYAPEILEHSRRIGKKFDLYRDALFQTQIKDITWNDEEHRWMVTTNRGDIMRARFVIMSNGPLNRPKLPGIPGIETYKGHTFHTSRWDYAYTGGDTTGNLHKLADKKVAVIGTGATAVQCVPYLAQYAQHLYVFQRTPSSVDERLNHPTDPEWVKTLAPGWQKRRMNNFNAAVDFTDLSHGGKLEPDQVGDGWTDINRHLAALSSVKHDPNASPEERERLMIELADFRKMNQVRARVDAVVKDKKTAEALKPWYRQFCKRPTFNDEYLPTFNRPNVTLVDTQGRGVERITEKGLVFDGVEYEVDCIIFATGFEVGTAYTRRAGFEVYGRGGKSLTEHWSKGIRTLHGFYSSGFPNCFHMGITQNTVTANFPHMLEDQARHITEVIQHAKAHEARCLEPTAEAEAEWLETIKQKESKSLDFQLECTPGYYNNEGQLDKGPGFVGGLYGGGPIEFQKIVDRWLSDGEMKGLKFS